MRMYIYVCVYMESLVSFVLYVTFIFDASSDVADQGSQIQEALGMCMYVYIRIYMYMRVAYPGGEASLRGPEGRIWPDDFWKKNFSGGPY